MLSRTRWPSLSGTSTSDRSGSHFWSDAGTTTPRASSWAPEGHAHEGVARRGRRPWRAGDRGLGPRRTRSALDEGFVPELTRPFLALRLFLGRRGPRRRRPEHGHRPRRQETEPPPAASSHGCPPFHKHLTCAPA